VREGGTLEIRAHYVLQSEQGERVEIISEGLGAAAPEVLAQLAAGEDVPPERYYFRTVIRMATAAQRLSHVNDLLYIGSGERRARRVTITVYQVP